MYLLGMCSMAWLLFGTATSELIDDFSRHGPSPTGWVRSGWGLNLDRLSYPQQFIQIRQDEYLLETVSSSFSNQAFRIVTGKSLKLRYRAFTPGQRTFKFLQAFPDHAHSPPLISSVQVNVLAGPNQILVPFYLFVGVDLDLCFGVGIGGPLIVYQIELIEDVTPLVSVNELHIVRQFESTPYPSFGRTQTDARHNSNVNSRGLSRFGTGITRVDNGIQISSDGFLHEEIVPRFNLADLSTRFIRIWYTTTNQILRLRLKICRSRARSTSRTQTFNANVPILAGLARTVDVAISRFATVRPGDCVSVRIFGRIGIQRLELVTVSLRGRFSNEQIELIDDLTIWPILTTREVPNVSNNHVLTDPINLLRLSSPHVNAQNTRSAESYTPSASQMDYVGEPLLNSLNYPYGGHGYVVNQQGLILTNDGLLIEPIAPYTGSVNLTGAFLFLTYTAFRPIMRHLNIHQAVSLRSHDQVLCIDVHFNTAIARTISVEIGECTFAQSIRIGGQGELIIHQIVLQVPIIGHPGQFTAHTVHNFLSASSTNGLADSSPHAIASQTPALASNNHLVPNELSYCILVNKDGMEVKENEYLVQDLPSSSNGMYLIIEYTATYQGTRKVVIEAFDGLGGVLVSCRALHVVFNMGNFKQVSIKIPVLLSNDSGSVIRVRIFGHLVIYKLTMFDRPHPLEIKPGDSVSDAFLIDDFYNWSNPLINNLEYGRDFKSNHIGRGVITLSSSDQYLTEYFGDYSETLVLNPLALRILYTTTLSVSCRLSLIPKPCNESDGSTELPIYIDLVFNPGTRVMLMVPILDMQRNNPNSIYPMYGMRINGPNVQFDHEEMHTLDIHRLEFAGIVPYTTSFDLAKEPAHNQLPLSFENKQFYLERQLMLLQTPGENKLQVNRKYLWTCAYQIVHMNPQDLWKRTKIEFVDENGSDLGGLRREFFSLMADIIINPNYALFTSSPEANYALEINPSSSVHKDHLNYFRLVGRIIGMAIFNGDLLGIKFVPTVYRKILQKQVIEQSKHDLVLEPTTSEIDISDLKKIDPDVHKNLMWVLSNFINEDHGLTMTMDWDFHGKKKPIDLVKNGSQIPVTQSNKKQYVQEYAKWRLYKLVQNQANALKDGVWDVIPQTLLSAFTGQELELLIGGNPDLNVDDWETYTKYEEGYTRTHPVIKVFWQCVRSWEHAQKAKLLQFVTGSNRVPSSGFKRLEPRFTIMYAPGLGRIPAASTCFNLLKLPPYLNVDEMCKQLVFASQVEQSAFGFA